MAAVEGLETYAARIERAREQMAAEGLDYLFVGPGSDLLYLTGYNAHLSERLNLLIIGKDGFSAMVVPVRAIDVRFNPGGTPGAGGSSGCSIGAHAAESALRPALDTVAVFKRPVPDSPEPSVQSPLAVLSRSVGPPPRTVPCTRRRSMRPWTVIGAAMSRLPDEVLASSVNPCSDGTTTLTSPEAADSRQSPVGLPSTSMLPLPVLAESRPTTPFTEMLPLAQSWGRMAGAHAVEAALESLRQEGVKI